MKDVYLELDSSENLFVLRGNTKPLSDNRRTAFSLKRMKADIQASQIVIPFEENAKESTFFQIQAIFKKYGISDNPSDEVKLLLDDYYRERDSFSEFSNRAKLIRNDEFKDDEELTGEFRQFTEVVSRELVRSLYPLQLLSSYHLAFSQHACNFAVPGAGKTTIVYAAYSYLKSIEDHHKHVDKILVIGPKASFAPWENEYEECFGRKPSSIRIDGSIPFDERKNHLYSANPAELTLVSYGSVSSLVEHIYDYLGRNKVMVVIDEAHKIKAKDGTWSTNIIGLAEKAASRVVLTGTPIPNGYQDLYNLIRFIWPHKYKDILGFHHGNLQQMTKDGEIDTQRVHRLTENVSPFFIRIKKEDLKLPEAIDHPATEVVMGPRQKEIYNFIESKYIDEFANNQSASLKDVFNKARLIRLRQAATNPALLNRPLEDYYHELGIVDDIGIDDSSLMKRINDYSDNEVPAKFEAALELLKKLLANDGEKAIIWSIFVQNARDLQDYLQRQGIGSKLLIGSVDELEREDIIEKFNNPENDEFRAVIANPMVVGESISIHKGCHNAIYLERDYNAASLIQSKDRIHRVGLDPGTVTNYFYLVAADTVDQVIHTKLDEKVTRMSKFINKEIPLFVNNLDFEEDETDLVKELIRDYARRNK